MRSLRQFGQVAGREPLPRSPGSNDGPRCCVAVHPIETAGPKSTHLHLYTSSREECSAVRARAAVLLRPASKQSLPLRPFRSAPDPLTEPPEPSPSAATSICHSCSSTAAGSSYPLAGAPLHSAPCAAACWREPPQRRHRRARQQARTHRLGELRERGKRGGSVCLNTVRGVSKWLRRPFQAAAGIGVARLMYAWSGVFPPSDECGLLPL